MYIDLWLKVHILTIKQQEIILLQNTKHYNMKIKQR